LIRAFAIRRTLGWWQIVVPGVIVLLALYGVMHSPARALIVAALVVEIGAVSLFLADVEAYYAEMLNAK